MKTNIVDLKLSDTKAEDIMGFPTQTNNIVKSVMDVVLKDIETLDVTDSKKDMYACKLQSLLEKAVEKDGNLTLALINSLSK